MDMCGKSNWNNAWSTHRFNSREKLNWIYKYLPVRIDRFLYTSLRRVASVNTVHPLKYIELGCAPGNMLNIVGRFGLPLELHGADYSQNGLAMAGEFLSKQGINVQYILEDIFEAPTREMYDVVASYGVVEHFNSLESVLAAHSKYLRKNGWLLVTLPNFSNPLLKSYRQRFVPESLETHNLDIMNLGIAKTIEQCGFTNVTGRAIGSMWFPLPCGRSPHMRAVRAGAFTVNQFMKGLSFFGIHGHLGFLAQKK